MSILFEELLNKEKKPQAYIPPAAVMYGIKKNQEAFATADKIWLNPLTKKPYSLYCDLLRIRDYLKEELTHDVILNQCLSWMHSKPEDHETVKWVKLATIELKRAAEESRLRAMKPVPKSQNVLRIEAAKKRFEAITGGNQHE